MSNIICEKTDDTSYLQKLFKFLTIYENIDVVSYLWGNRCPKLFMKIPMSQICFEHTDIAIYSWEHRYMSQHIYAITDVVNYLL